MGPGADHYRTLGVEPAASASEIRRRYLELARTAHPDFHTDSEVDRAAAELRMRDINAAWAVLGDPDARSSYDVDRLRREREAARRGAPSRPAPPFHATAAAHEAFHPFDDGPDLGFDEAHDAPITPARLPNWLVLAPPMILVWGLGSLVAGSLINVVALVDFGLIAMLVAGVLFLLAPLVALGASRRGDRLRR